MRKKLFKSRTEIIQAGLAGNGADDPVLRAFPPAIGEVRTLPAILRQGLALGVNELHLGAGKHLAVERGGPEVAEAMLRIDIMVAGINAPVVFHRHAFAAKFAVD